MTQENAKPAQVNWLSKSGEAARNWLGNPVAAWLFLLISLSLTVFAWRLSDSAVRAASSQRFDYQAQEIASAIRQRLQAYEMVLRSGEILFNASEDVSREEWLVFVNDLRIEQRFPGIQSLGFVLAQPASVLSKPSGAIPAEGVTQSSRRFDRERASSKQVGQRATFGGQNQTVFGRDMFADPALRTAMTLAVESGLPAVSGRVWHPQKSEAAPDKAEQSGFLMYMPVFRQGMATSTAEERRAAIHGFVYATFRMPELMQGILGPEGKGIEFELFAANNPSRDTLLYATDGHSDELHALDPHSSATFKQQIPLEIANSLWTLFVRAPKAYLTREEALLPALVAGGGVALNLLLFWIFWFLARQNRRVERNAQSLVRKLSESESRYQALFGRTRTPMLLIDPVSTAIIEANPAAATFYGYPQSVLGTMTISQINTLSADGIRSEMTLARQHQKDVFYFQHRLASGEVRDVEVHSGAFENEGRELLYSIIHDISKRKKVESELVASEQRYRFVMQATGEGVWDWDVASNTVRHNLTWCDILGMDSDQLEHPLEFFIELLHKDDVERVKAAIRLTVEHDEPYVSEYRMRRSDGELIWVLDRGKVVERDAEGKAVRMVGCISDITSRRNTEQALVDERLKLQTLLNEASDGIHVLNSDGELILCSQSFARMLGYSPEELEGLNVCDWDAVWPADLLREKLLVLIQEPRVFETRHQRKDGSTFDVEISTSSIVLSGKPCIYASARDITLRKQQELEIATQRNRMQNILEGTRVGTWEWTVPTGEVVFNERWAEMLGYTLEELAPVSSETWRRLLHPDDLQECEARLKAHFAGESSYFECEVRMRHKDGRWIWVLDRGRVFSWSEEGLPQKMAGTHQDITRQKEIEQGLVESRRAADAANLAKSQFLATMSHEIRTPMNGILGMAQLLLMQDNSEEERQVYLRTIYNSGQSLLTVLNDILDLSKVEAGRIKLESVAFSPAQVLHEVAALFVEVAKKKNLTITADHSGAGDQSQRYWGDSMRIRQVLSNLVSNAIKFTEAGTIHLSLTLVKRNEQCARLRFAIKDTGIGISASERSQLFSPFTQADSTITRRFGGTGLGLAISKNLVELMHGSLEVESNPGLGSTFWFELPLTYAEQGEECRSEGSPRKPQALHAESRSEAGRSVHRFDGVEQPPVECHDLALSEDLWLSLAPQLDMLDELLGKQMMRSRKVASEIARVLSGTAAESAFVPVAEAIEQLKYELARESLHKFIATVCRRDVAAAREEGS